MAYKKYIKRGDKIYGPYIYKSKRRGDKIITEYLGKEKKGSFRNDENLTFFWAILSLIIILVTLLILNHYFTPTGRVVLEPSPVYELNETIKGMIKVNMKHGELIPADSSVIISLAGQEKKFILDDLISGNVREGNFFAENTVLEGKGEGYGFPGEKKIYPTIHFKLSVHRAEETKEEDSEEIKETEEKGEEVKEKKPENVTEEQAEENVLEEIGEENVTIAEEKKERKEPEKNKTKPKKEKTKQEQKAEKQATQIQSQEQPAEKTIKEAEEETQSTAIVTEKPIGIEETSETEETTEPGITGSAVSESVIIEASLSALEPFTYELGKREAAEIIEGSVRTDERNLSSSIYSFYRLL